MKGKINLHDIIVLAKISIHFELSRKEFIVEVHKFSTPLVGRPIIKYIYIKFNW